MKDENGKLIAENGDLSIKMLKKVYDTSISNSLAQAKRRNITSERLKAVRVNNNLRQKELCDKIGVMITTYSGYENGKHDIPTDIIARICELFEISADYIIGISDNPKGKYADKTEKAQKDEKSKSVDNLNERIEALENALKMLNDRKKEESDN